MNSVHGPVNCNDNFTEADEHIVQIRIGSRGFVRTDLLQASIHIHTRTPENGRSGINKWTKETWKGMGREGRPHPDYSSSALQAARTPMVRT